MKKLNLVFGCVVIGAALLAPACKDKGAAPAEPGTPAKVEPAPVEAAKADPSTPDAPAPTVAGEATPTVTGEATPTAVAPEPVAAGAGDPGKDAYPELGKPAVVQLLSAGEGAKAPLRWKAEKGATERLSMVLDTKMDIRAGGQAMPMNISMTMDMDGRVLDVKEDGSSVVSMTVTDASMKMPGMDGAGAADMVRDMLKGMTIEATMDPRGAMTGTKVSGGNELMKQLGGQMDDSLDQMAIPFPEEPVGVGAKWRALTQQESNGMKVRMMATYELEKLDGTMGEVTMTIKQFADAQTMKMNGVDADLKSLTSAGTGSMSFDLTRPIMAKAEIKLKMDASMVIMGQSADMKVDATVSMIPKGPIE
ncbi:MAG: hypothetical protein CVU56_18250 [Deltaproteobacteria bacterium HGW-Deltaproteobacteria-14]|nr:MAG: hypothetical protein CVU56_18250 [Deltaproteobacteria bacterium HGW-Deltaproteobacteria-14]